MKITRVEPILCSAGRKPWVFVKVSTDEGIVGYAECSGQGSLTSGVVGCIKDFEQLLLGKDPRPVEKLYYDMNRFEQTPGGIAHKAMGGIEVALWDIKAKALGVPLYELFGGPYRDKIRLYWSHCGTYQALDSELFQTSPLRTLEDVANLGREVVSRGFTALKTNILVPGAPAYIISHDASSILDSFILAAAERLIRTFREAVGNQVDICLDVGQTFKTEGFIRLANILEPYNLMWLEIDTFDPKALLQIKQSTKVPICTGETLYGRQGVNHFLELHAMDVLQIDVPLNGFSEARRMAALADVNEINVTSHNYNSHLSSLMSAHFLASVPNVKIMEKDVVNVPWRDDIITEPPNVKDGYIYLPKTPGLGAELNEKEIAKHPWSK